MPLSVFRSWSVQDRALALALDAHDAGVCSGCGGHLVETTDDEIAWDVSMPVRCHRCTAIGSAMEAAQSNPQPQALHFHTRQRRRPRGRP